jgi:hypothetical protein
MCTINVCLHRSHPIIVVFFKPLPYDKTIIGQNIFTCLLTLTDNAYQHLWVHNVNMEVIINNKKTLANGWMMVRLPQCSLSFYNCKSHNLYCCCHITRCQITNRRVFNICTTANNILCCQIKEIKINITHTFNNINTMQQLFLSFGHCTMKTLHPTMQNHK